MLKVTKINKLTLYPPKSTIIPHKIDNITANYATAGAKAHSC